MRRIILILILNLFYFKAFAVDLEKATKMAEFLKRYNDYLCAKLEGDLKKIYQFETPKYRKAVSLSDYIAFRGVISPKALEKIRKTNISGAKTKMPILINPSNLPKPFMLNQNVQSVKLVYWEIKEIFFDEKIEKAKVISIFVYPYIPHIPIAVVGLENKIKVKEVWIREKNTWYKKPNEYAFLISGAKIKKEDINWRYKFSRKNLVDLLITSANSLKDKNKALKMLKVAALVDPKYFLSKNKALREFLLEFLEYYKKNLISSPICPTPWNFIGEIYLMLNLLKDAETAFNMVISVKPDNINAHINLCNTYTKEKKYKFAIAEYRKLLELTGYSPSNFKTEADKFLFYQINPCENIEDLLDLGILLAQRRMWNKSFKVFFKILSCDKLIDKIKKSFNFPSGKRKISSIFPKKYEKILHLLTFYELREILKKAEIDLHFSNIFSLPYNIAIVSAGEIVRGSYKYGNYGRVILQNRGLISLKQGLNIFTIDAKSGNLIYGLNLKNLKKNDIIIVVKRGFYKFKQKDLEKLSKIGCKFIKNLKSEASYIAFGKFQNIYYERFGNYPVWLDLMKGKTFHSEKEIFSFLKTNFRRKKIPQIFLTGKTLNSSIYWVK